MTQTGVFLQQESLVSLLLLDTYEAKADLKPQLLRDLEAKDYKKLEAKPEATD